ncbi:MAG TPA: isoprenylcysteine carboxylmethyltransferase family protein [Pseudomonadota bacterium]|nr:isoprenylcysteine carboxylmethyltransferase family protein [Rhodanobacteraceae bacterium]MBP9155900.1 isoprenylcysteine carboxylmethyltransferase family protein [Xanthomonadales bacterium]HQW81839.1 isoprenylcysteine carboxylmethyltransferase family protein [Pseudomonadota bacterium]
MKKWTSLEHAIPPPVIAILCAAFAWAIARWTPEFAYLLPARLPIAGFFVVAGVALDLSGLIAFRQARTTINPLAPDKSTAIVRSGPYRFTRNPMYLGMVMILLGICAYLANALSAFAVVVFVAYITRFQIMPEERLLSEKFGEPFMHYKQSVRRWL